MGAVVDVDPFGTFAVVDDALCEYRAAPAACARLELAPCPLMSGFERLMREISLYLECIAIAREAV